VDHGEGTSSHFKKKKKNDKRRRDDHLVAVGERKASHPKGKPSKPSPPKDHFEKLLDAPWRTTRSPSSMHSRTAG
jgi:hypothetical protein